MMFLQYQSENNPKKLNIDFFLAKNYGDCKCFSLKKLWVNAY